MSSMFTTPEIRARVEARIREVQALISKRYPQYSARWPIITYTTKNTAGGLAFLTRNTVDYNPILLNAHTDAFIARTVGHEIAHLAAYELFQDRGHGRMWKHIMLVIGQEPSRCHSYNIVGTDVKTKKSMVWVCTGCGAQGLCMKKRAQRMAAGTIFRHRCANGAKAPVRVVGHKNDIGQALKVADKSTPVVKPVVAKAPKSGTKLECCQTIKTSHPEYSRDQLIQAFMLLVGMTKAGATTYYYKVK